MANRVVASLAVEIAANTAAFTKSLNQSNANFSKFTAGILKAGAALGLAFGGKEIVQAGFEMAKLAGEAEGVKAAFDRLPESAKLMNDLKDATSGTVSELDLMKRTVQASNFGISLESLPELLKFAAIRAQQTGQSVDYLVDSIITGIGRKSPLILDNLGISAVRLKEKFNGASLEAQNIGDVAQAVGKIASEELEKMGDFSDNTSSKVQRLDASWENFKVTLGGVINQSGILQKILDGTTDLLQVTAKDQSKALNLLLEQLNSGAISGDNYAKALDFAQQAAAKLGVQLVVLTENTTGLQKVLIDPRSKPKFVEPKEIEKQIVTLESLQEKIKFLNEQFSDTDATDKKKLANIGAEILKTRALIDELEKFRQKQAQVNEERRDVNVDTSIASPADAILDLSKLPDKIEIPQGLRDFLDSLKDFGQETTEEIYNISGMVANSIAGLADAIGQAFASGDFDNFGIALLESVASFAQQLGGLMIAMGLGEIALKGAPGPAKVIAGIALVAAAGAIKGLLSKQKHPTAGTSGGGGGRSGSSGGFTTQPVTAAQNSMNIAVDDVRIAGQDIWLSFKAYEQNGKFTKIG